MKIHWKTVMFIAILGMLVGLAMSLFGLGYGNLQAAWIGLVVIMAVCVSWWFWVMFVIRTMIECTEQTTRSLGEIKYDIREVRSIVQGLDSNIER